MGTGTGQGCSGQCCDLLSVLRRFGFRSQKPGRVAGGAHGILISRGSGRAPCQPCLPWGSEAPCWSFLHPLPGWPGLPLPCVSPPRVYSAGPGSYRASVVLGLGWGSSEKGPTCDGLCLRWRRPWPASDPALSQPSPPALESLSLAQQPPWASRPLPTCRPLRPSSLSLRCPLGGDPTTRPDSEVSVAPLRGEWVDPPASGPPGWP